MKSTLEGEEGDERRSQLKRREKRDQKTHLFIYPKRQWIMSTMSDNYIHSNSNDKPSAICSTSSVFSSPFPPQILRGHPEERRKPRVKRGWTSAVARQY